jgi:hypothetical protein
MLAGHAHVDQCRAIPTVETPARQLGTTGFGQASNRWGWTSAEGLEDVFSHSQVIAPLESHRG